MVKKKFENAVLEVVCFYANDLIVTSTPFNADDYNGIWGEDTDVFCGREAL